MADDERYVYPPSGPVQMDKVPGTGGISPAASALVGFAKGLAGRLEQDRQAKDTNQRVAMQYLISGGHVEPAYRGAQPDFMALGMPWRVRPAGSGIDANEQSLIEQRRYDMLKSQSDAGMKIAEEVEKRRSTLYSKLESNAMLGIDPKMKQEAYQKVDEDLSAYEESLWQIAFNTPSYDQRTLKAQYEARKRNKSQVGTGDATSTQDKMREFLQQRAKK